MKLGYLGPAGSYSQSAAELFAQRYCDEQNVMLLPMVGFTPILQMVEDGALELACIPVENALEGSVAEVLDALALKMPHTQIVAELVRPIQHALIRRIEFIEGIRFVHSHPQAIGQCRDAVYELLGPDINFIPESSTSEAVRGLLGHDETHAALGSVEAARHYGLDVLIENLGNLSHNATRFVIVSGPLPVSLAFKQNLPYKTSLCVGLPHNRPGALLNLLNVLASYQLNLSKIESRPTKRSLGEYLFYFDVEGLIPPEATDALQAQTDFYRVLGVYPVLGVLSPNETTSQAK